MTVCGGDVTAVASIAVQDPTGSVQVVTAPSSRVDTYVVQREAGMVTCVSYVVHVADCSSTVTTAAAPLVEQTETTSTRL